MTDTRSRVRFEIKTYCRQTEDYWISKSLETGLTALGRTHDEAEKENGQDNLALARWLIENEGLDRLYEFFDEHGMKYLLVDESQVEAEQVFHSERQELFA